MTYTQSVRIEANNEADAERIARAMASASGTFSPQEWEAIARKVQSRTVQARIRFLL